MTTGIATTPTVLAWCAISRPIRASPCGAKRVLLLGAGGAVRGVIGPLLLRGRWFVVNRTHATAVELVVGALRNTVSGSRHLTADELSPMDGVST